MKRKIYMLILVIFDQVVKGIIHLWFMNRKVTFFRSKIGFTPYLNKNQLSIFNHELNMELGILTLIVINVLSVFILIYLYPFTKKREYTNVFYEITFIFLFSGVLCSLIDKIIYKGSIDYILFDRHICDLKDIYLLLGALFSIMYLYTYLKHEVKKSKSE